MTSLALFPTRSPRTGHAIIDLLNLYEKSLEGKRTLERGLGMGGFSLSSLGGAGEGEVGIPQPAKPSGRSFHRLSLEGEVGFLSPVGCLLSLVRGLVCVPCSLRVN